MEKLERLDVFDSRSHWIILSIIAVSTTLIGLFVLAKNPAQTSTAEMLFLSVFLIGAIYSIKKSLQPTKRFTLYRNGILFYPSFFISYGRILRLHYEYRGSGKSRKMYLIFTYEAGSKDAEYSLPTTFLELDEAVNELLKSLGGENPIEEITVLTKIKDEDD